MKKYNSRNPFYVSAQRSKEEMEYNKALLDHRPGDPRPANPDPNFDLDEWLRITKR